MQLKPSIGRWHIASMEALIMADDLKNRGAQDPRRVNIQEDYEVRYWTEKWGVSKEQLAQAVRRQACQLRLLPASWGRRHEREYRDS